MKLIVAECFLTNTCGDKDFFPPYSVSSESGQVTINSEWGISRELPDGSKSDNSPASRGAPNAVWPLWWLLGCGCVSQGDHIATEGAVGLRKLKHLETHYWYHNFSIFFWNKEALLGLLPALVNVQSPEKLILTNVPHFQLLLQRIRLSEVLPLQKCLPFRNPPHHVKAYSLCCWYKLFFLSLSFLFFSFRYLRDSICKLTHSCTNQELL